MTVKPDLTQDFVRSILDYCAETGEFHWKARPKEMFKDDGPKGAQGSADTWNKRFAGTKAGTIDADGYVIIQIGKPHNYRAHVIAWLWHYGEWRPGGVDHKHGVRDDNRISELRAATKSQNGMNKRRQSNNTSGFIGVNFNSQRGLWEARATIERRTYRFGFFTTPEAAAEKRAQEIARIHGEFVPADEQRKRYAHRRDL